MDNFISEMEEYAYINNIPIMQKDGIEFLLNFIREHNIKTILEIGTAIGYSSIRMASLNDNINITTVERDKQRYDIAISNINACSLSHRIDVIFADALDIDLGKKYDLIFIDAAKGKNIEFFEKFEKNLNIGGYIVTDNLKFHGLVDQDISKIESRNVRGLVKKIRKYIDYLKENEKYITEFLDVGDGISVSKKES